MTKAIYAGSFDPVTRGHADIIRKAASTFDELVVAIGTNPKKTRLFSVKESIDMIRDTIDEYLLPSQENRVSVAEFTGMSLAAYARQIDATHIVRGLRQISDFNDEFTFTGANEQIAPKLTITHFICKAKYLHVSSSTAKELAKLREPIDWLVTPKVRDALNRELA